MQHRYLLDTNILSDLVRNPQGLVAQKIAEAGEESICTSIIVASEMRFGAAKRGSDRLANKVNAILESLEIVSFQTPMDQAYANIRGALESDGKPIGANDLLIAAQAKTLNLCLVTANLREFERVRGLTVENWL